MRASRDGMEIRWREGEHMSERYDGLHRGSTATFISYPILLYLHMALL